MDQDRWDPLNDARSIPEPDRLPGQAIGLGADEQTDEQAMEPTENPKVVPPDAQPETPAPDQRDMTGGALLPNDASEQAEDKVDEASLESFPASDSPAW